MRGGPVSPPTVYGALASYHCDGFALWSAEFVGVRVGGGPYCGSGWYLSSQVRTSWNSRVRGTKWLPSSTTWRFWSPGVPSSRNIGICDVSSGKKKSYRPLIIRVGIRIRGRKLIGSTSG